jgi:hypothetical protein
MHLILNLKPAPAGPPVKRKKGGEIRRLLGYFIAAMTTGPKPISWASPLAARI